VARREATSLAVALSGDLDMAATFKVEPELERLLGEQDVRRLDVDLGDVGFVDSAGLGLLLSIRERTRNLGIDMRLVRVSEPVRRILEIGGTRLT
jgi:anti-anti-sigma factor